MADLQPISSPTNLPAKVSPGPRHHLVIAGTGRAGTTFLVEFLGACGLDVGASHHWLERQRAGMEHYLLAPDCPYVAKDPWLFAYCEALDLAEVKIDALI